MIKRDAVSYFKSYYFGEIGLYQMDRDFPALCELWNNFTDSLCKSGIITLKQYETWSNPIVRTFTNEIRVRG